MDGNSDEAKDPRAGEEGGASGSLALRPAATAIVATQNPGLTRRRNRRNARYHAQIEIEGLGPESRPKERFVGFVEVSARLHRLYRGDGRLKVGDLARFDALVFNWGDFGMPHGDHLIMFERGKLAIGVLAEVMFNGDPPKLVLVDFEKIEDLSPGPRQPVGVVESSWEVTEPEGVGIVVVRFLGRYPDGSNGNPVARAMLDALDVALDKSRAPRVVIDLTRFEYRFGDEIGELAEALRLDGTRFRPCALVATGATAAALAPLVSPHGALGVAGAALASTLEQAIERVAREAAPFQPRPPAPVKVPAPIPDEGALASMVDQLRDRNRLRVREAVVALQRIGARDAIPALIDAFDRTPHFSVRKPVLEALEVLGADAGTIETLRARVRIVDPIAVVLDWVELSSIHDGPARIHEQIVAENFRREGAAASDRLAEVIRAQVAAGSRGLVEALRPLGWDLVRTPALEDAVRAVSLAHLDPLAAAEVRRIVPAAVPDPLPNQAPERPFKKSTDETTLTFCGRTMRAIEHRLTVFLGLVSQEARKPPGRPPWLERLALVFELRSRLHYGEVELDRYVKNSEEARVLAEIARAAIRTAHGLDDFSRRMRAREKAQQDPLGPDFYVEVAQVGEAFVDLVLGLPAA